MSRGTQLDRQNEPRLLNREEIEGIAQRLKKMSRGGGATYLRIDGYWAGDLRWARNRVSLASDRRDLNVTISREVRRSYGDAKTNQLDDASLEAALRVAERLAAAFPNGKPYQMFQVREPVLPSPSPNIWSDATSQMTADTRTTLSKLLIDEAEAKEMLSAGYLEMREMERASWSDTVGQPGDGTVASGKTDWAGKGGVEYIRATQAQCSMTVRHPRGIGSGWAGLSSVDWARIDGPSLAARALQKCIASLNPVAVEPGRYTVVLEAQAVSDLLKMLWRGAMVRSTQELGDGPFSRDRLQEIPVWTTKLGLKVMDERITISSDPNDPEQGVFPRPGLARVNWIDRGILTNLSYDREYAVDKLRENSPVLYPGGYRMSGGTSSIEQMIERTKRGLLVTRFSNMQMVDGSSLLSAAYTRDGLWLIENGKISKAVKNLRITESPLFVLNNVEELGIPVPVFHPYTNLEMAFLTPVIVPPLKANDFSFTSLADAI